jgi:hypothetical protein
MKDVAVTLVLVLSFAALVTAHVAIVIGLVLKEPRWRAAVALLVAPLAPYWAIATGMKARGWAWIGSVCLYSAALLFVSRCG